MRISESSTLAGKEARQGLPCLPPATEDGSIESLLQLCHLQVLVGLLDDLDHLFPAMRRRVLLYSQMGDQGLDPYRIESKILFPIKFPGSLSLASISHSFKVRAYSRYCSSGCSPSHRGAGSIL